MKTPTPDELKAAVLNEVTENLYIEGESDLDEGTCHGEPPDCVWRLKLKEGHTVTVYENKPADSPQWFFLYRLFGLESRAMRLELNKVISRWKQPIPHDHQSDNESNLRMQVNKLEGYLYEINIIAGAYEPQLATS